MVCDCEVVVVVSVSVAVAVAVVVVNKRYVLTYNNVVRDGYSRSLLACASSAVYSNIERNSIAQPREDWTRNCSEGLAASQNAPNGSYGSYDHSTCMGNA